MACDQIETAEKGRICDVCHQICDAHLDCCVSCQTIATQLQQLQVTAYYGSSLIHVLLSLQRWAKDVPARDLVRGFELLTQPFNKRYVRPEQQRIAPFIVIEGADSVGKTFHAEAVAVWLTKQGFAVQGLTFPNNRTPLGRFLKRALKEQIPSSTFTHHILFSLHRWEFATWIVDMLSRNYAIVVERYAWSGLAYSWASEETIEPYPFMMLDVGLPQPDLVLYIHTSFADVVQCGGIPPSLFVDFDFSA